jgi:CHAT domain-containing protein
VRALPRMTAWSESLAAYERARQHRDQRARRILEAVLEDLYTQAREHGPERMVELEDVLGVSPDLPEAAAWRALLALCLRFDEPLLVLLDATLAQAPPRSAWLIAAEAARLTYQAVGPQAAWERIAAVEPVPADEPWLDEGPLVIHALLVKLRLAAASGNWAAHDQLVEPSCARFGSPDDPHAVRIRLASADHDVLRGDYARAARTLDRLEPWCRGDLRLELLAIRLHALVACAAQQRDTRLREAIERTMAELDQASHDTAAERYRLPAAERADLLRRVEQLVDHAGADARAIEPHQVTSLAGALAVERRARREQTGRPPHETLAALLPCVEELLVREDAAEHCESWIRLRLLWCRLIVDVGDVDRYEDCELVLTEIIDETTRAGLVPLAMSAHDQRAVLRALEPIRAWDLALADAGAAGDLAVALLARNASAGKGERVMERALLGTLLPVLDRVVELLLEGALAWEPDGGAARPGWERERLARWLRFGRAVHDYVEQSQVLALKEARYAYGAGDAPVPHRFALVAPGQAVESPLLRLRRALRRRDVILQYFVTGPHIAIFVYDRDRFDWVVVDAATAVQRTGARLEAPTAHAALLHLVAACHAWLTGESSPEHEASAEPLRWLLLPEVITAHLERARARHVRIVPHDVLYRVPFGRLRWRERRLLERCSLSFHPTAGLAAEGAAHALRPRQRKILGHLSGPDLAAVEAERASIGASLGRGARLARLVAIDSSRAESTAEVVARIAELDILHLACHGVRPLGRREAFLALGTGPWKLSEMASLRMPRCALAILQSCWTGWMEHERTNPVQGFPQAFCDAGVGAVIAPLVAVPDSLTPVFASVLYRTLRFLPAEQALRRTLDILREHGPALVAGDAQASRDWHELGPLDVLEYRYVGHTNLHLGGSRAARLMSWWSYWRWLRRLRRQSRAAAARPAGCDP